MAFGTFLFGVALINLLSFEGAHAEAWLSGHHDDTPDHEWILKVHADTPDHEWILKLHDDTPDHEWKNHANADSPADVPAKAKGPANADGPADVPAKTNGPANADGPADVPAKANGPANADGPADAEGSADVPADVDGPANAEGSADGPADAGDPPQPRKCGKTPKSGYMPWLAVISVDGDPCCFGSLISPDVVLTDGHCGFGPESNVQISLGNMVTADHGDSCQELRNVEYFKCNEPTAKSHLTKDGICLLKLSSPVNFTENVSPICLPESSECPFPTGMPSYLTTGISPGDLVNVPIVGYNECKCSYPTLNQYQICAGQGYGPPRLNRCLDNLGAGVVTKIDGFMTLVGVVSVDQSCTDHGYLRPFTAVAPFYSFIQGVACDIPPVFIPFHPTGFDPDTNFVCSAPRHPEPGPPVDGKEGFEDIFTDGVAGMHSSPFIFLCVLVLSLFITH